MARLHQVFGLAEQFSIANKDLISTQDESIVPDRAHARANIQCFLFSQCACDRASARAVTQKFSLNDVLVDIWSNRLKSNFCRAQDLSPRWARRSKNESRIQLPSFLSVRRLRTVAAASSIERRVTSIDAQSCRSYSRLASATSPRTAASSI